MADNTRLPLGTEDGDTYRSDDNAGVKTQAVKLELGTDGNFDGFVAASNPLPVGDAGGSLTVDVGTPLPAGTNNIGDVDVLSLPALPAGTNNIGDVDVLTLPALPAGTNNIGDVDVLSLPALPAGTNNIGDVDVLTLPALPAGTNQIGQVEAVGDVASDSPIAANPVTVGARASTAAPTAVSADGDAVNVWADRRGAQKMVMVDDAGDSTMDDANNALRVNVVAGAAGGVSHTDDAAFTVGTSAVVPAAGTYRTTRDNVDDGDAGAFAMTQKRGLFVSPETPAGDSLADDTNDHLKVGGPVAHDSANAGNINPLLIGARAADSPLSAVSADGDAVMMRADRLGQLGVRLFDSTGDSCSDDANDAIRVNVVAGGSSGNGTSMADDAAFTPGTTSVTPAAGTYRVTRDLLDDGDAGAIALTESRGVFVSLEDTSGSPVGTAGAPLRVDPTGTTSQPTHTNDWADTDSITSNGDAATQANVGGAGRGAISIDVSGTWVATLEFEYTLDLSTWLPLPVYPLGSSSSVTSTAANGQWFAANAAFQRVRVRASAYTSGTAVVKISQSRASWQPPTTGGGGGTEYTEDAAAAANPAGGALIVVRDDARGGSLTSADGDNVALRGTNAGELYVKHVDSVTTTLGAALPAGTNNIGDVDVLSLPALPAGTNNIGDVDVLTLPAVADSITDDAITALNDTVTAGVSGQGVVGIEITGTWVATLKFEGAVEGSAWFSLNVSTPSGLVPAVQTTANGVWFVRAGGLTQIRVRADLFTSGTANVRLVVSTAANTPISIPLTASSLVTATGGLVTDDTADAVRSMLVDSAGAVVAKAEDAAHVSGDPGVMALAVRRDTAAVGSGTDGDYSTLNVNANGRLYTSATVDAALPAGTNNIGDVDIVTVPAPLSTTGGGTEATALRVTVASDSTGVLSVDDNGASLTVDSAQLPAALSGGRLDVVVGAALPAGTNNIGDVDVLTLPGVTGAAAHDAAVSGNPLLNGFEARTSDGTAVGSGDAVRGLADTLGKQVVIVGAVHDLQVRGTANYTGTTASDLVAAAGAGVRIAVMGVLVTNAHATVSTKVEIRDGTTVKIQGYAVAAGGGFALSGGGVPLFISTANTAVTGRCATTGSDVDITVWGYKIAN